MNNLYHKVAVASVCTALSFTLGANQEAKAATFILTNPTFSQSPTLPVGINWDDKYEEEFRALYEFNIANLSLPSNTVINSAIFQVRANDFHGNDRDASLLVYGYIGNGYLDESDYEAGEYLTAQPIRPYSRPWPPDIFNFNVLPFINQRISNNDAFVGFGVRKAIGERAYVDLESRARLIVETADVAEPVPEPTTIFDSALALGVGGWLKRKKSTQHNKTTPQN